jgi:putative spermidine/putrescine transport system ATP-binding protein
MDSVRQESGRVELRGVAKSYGSVRALIDADLVVRPDESVAILGPSGSGKSTLLGVLAGFIEADRGDVMFGDIRMNDVPTHKRGVGMVFQRYALFPNQTVFENLAFPLKLRKVPAAEIERRVNGTLDLVGLASLGGRYPAALSGGQAQRVALARALVFTPRVLLMDEPLGALDRQLRAGLQVEIRRIQQSAGVPSIYVTHDQEEAMHLADRIVLIHGGRIVADSTPRALYQYPRTVWSANFLGSACILPVDRATTRADGMVAVSAGPAAGIAHDPHELAGTGKRLGLVLRPEEGRPSGGAGEDGTTGIVVDGAVVLTTFLGARQRVLVRCPNGAEVSVEISGRDDTPASGSWVRCLWPAGTAVIAEDAVNGGGNGCAI